MGNKLTNEEIAKVFAMYLGELFQFEDNEPDTIVGVYDTLIYGDEADESGEGIFSVDECKIYLKPLSSITDEDAIEVMQIEYDHILNEYETLKIERNEKGRITIKFRWKNLDKRRNLDDGYSYSSWATNFSTISKEVFQYLIQQGYAVPLFFGVNHWANNKSAIELGIAIEQK